MADARRGEERDGDRREQRDVRSRIQTADHPERTKADHLHSSQGPLSSIRAAIKRTRSNSQSDHTRERRRPEITIVSAEPLASSSWFSGVSVVFPPPPPPPQSGWSTGIQSVSQPPPSYDQVIEEKTKEEHIIRPTAAPRRITCTSTSSTQTDPVKEEASNSSGAPRPEAKRRAGEKPKKPPRPFLPKPLDRELDASSGLSGETNSVAPTNTENQTASSTGLKQQHQTDSTQARSVTVHWDNSKHHSSASSAEATPSSSDLGQRPVPLPRTKKLNILDTEEIKVQALVKLSESCEEFQCEENFSSNKYLEDLLEVFSGVNKEEEIDTYSEEAFQGEDVEGTMNSNHSQRNIRARIQAFESQAATEEGNVEPAKPEPKPRKAAIKPPVAAKPSVAQKPLLDQSNEENYQNISTTNNPQGPTPAPRPLPPKKPVGQAIRDELETLHNKAVIPKRPRPSVLTRSQCIYEDEPVPVLPPTPSKPPEPPAKPAKEPLKPNFNINNHNSASMTRGNEYVESPTIKPQCSVDSSGGTFPRQSLTRRPTTIRVPSKSDSVSDHVQDNPPPLPAQKPVGYLETSTNHNQSRVPVLPTQGLFQPGPEPSLPPRKPSTNKPLPPRPPPAKVGPGRPPPPSFKTAGQSHSASWEVSPKSPARGSHRKGPVLPPRPNPGHRLYNNYTLQLPHGIASFDHNGTNTGELSFQKNEVLLLLEEIDPNTFMCQVGDAKGKVNKARMKVITPLSSVSHMPQIQSVGPGGSGGSGLKVQAVYDFNPAGPGELGLKAGDVVTMVEQVDAEWYRGNCRGSTGFFPINHVKVLSNSPKPSPKPPPKPSSASVRGPRCVARFDFDGEHSDELTFSDGDVIQLMEYVGDDWARGKIGTSTGIFPLNFVEIIEDLPVPSQHQAKTTKIALPGMVASSNTHPEVAKPAQTSQSGVEWVVALYDFAGTSEGDLSFQKGDRILITQHIDAEWSCGRLNGREGIFPRAFVENSAGQQSTNNQHADESRAQALFDFTSDCEEELSLKAGDIITNLESVDEEWYLGDLRGKRALVPKNYVQVLK